jgi:hypothetical protein
MPNIIQIGGIHVKPPKNLPQVCPWTYIAVNCSLEKILYYNSKFVVPFYYF